MSGQTIPLFTKRTFTFSNLGISGTDEIVLVKAMSVDGWQEGQLVVRVHGGTWSAGTGDKIEVRAFQTAPSREDPSVDFFDTTAKATVTLTAADIAAAPFLETATLSTPFGSALRISVKGTQSSGSAVTMSAELSAELVVKD